MSQEKLGELLELSYQQVQKYEQGRSKITVELLAKLSEIFSVSVEELMSETTEASKSPPHSTSAADGTSYLVENIQEGELLREYRKLESPFSKDFVLRWLRSIVEFEQEMTDRKGYED